MSDNQQSVETGGQMQKLLKRAVASQPVPEHLDFKIRKALRQSSHGAPASRPNPWTWLVPGLGAAVLASTALIVFLTRGGGHTSMQNPVQYVAQMSAKVSSLMRIGLGDHIHCAVFRSYPKEPLPLQTMRQELGPEYAGLLDAVKANVPRGFNVQLAHRCRFDGRQFMHLVVKQDDRLMSVVVTAQKHGETFEADRLIPAMASSGISFYREHADSFQIAAYSTSNHLVYLISDLPASKNMDLLVAMSSSINKTLPVR